MASIQRYTATGQSVNPDAPTRIYDDPGAYEGRRLGGVISQTGSTFGDIAINIKELQTRTGYLQLKGMYDARAKQAVMEAERDPEVIQDPLNYHRIYMNKMDEFATSINNQVEDVNVKSLFNNYVAQSAPELSVASQANTLRLATFRQKASLITLGDQYSKLAGEAMPGKRDEYITDYKKEVDKARQSGLIENDVEATKMKTEFENRVRENNMAYWAKTNPEIFQTLLKGGSFDNVDKKVQATIINQAVDTQWKTDQRVQIGLNRATELTKNYWESKASFGEVDEETLTNGEAGNDPYVPDVRFWRQLRKTNDSAPGGGGNSSVDALKQEFEMGGDHTIARIEKYQGYARDLSQQIGRNDELTKFMHYLNTRKVELSNTARSLQSQEVAAGLARGRDLFGSQVIEPKIGMPMLDQPRASRDKIDQNALEVRIRDLVTKHGKSPEEASNIAVKEIIDKRQEEEKKAKENAQQNKANRLRQGVPGGSR